MTLRIGVLLLALLVGGLPACSKGGGTVDYSREEITRAAERLRGQWVLTDFRPVTALDPVLGALLGAQFNQMVLTFDGRHMGVQGVGISTQRAYEVREAWGDQFSGAVIEAPGVEYLVSGTFNGPQLYFTCKTTPWDGSGTLVRRQ